MINYKRIEVAISEAEQSFKECWLKLKTIQNGQDGKADLLNAVVSFQPTLGLALFKIESLYNAVCKEGRELVDRKSELNARWFHRRIQTLTGYKHLLQRTVDVGKVLGDSFAWIFYQHDRELLRRHYEHESTPHSPIGIGGRGELEVVRRLPKFGRYVVVAHSITTFLRLGDVSLIDPIRLKVAAIGELKIRADGNTHLVLSMNLVGAKLSQDMLPEFPASNPSGMPRPKASLPPQIFERLKRQINRIREAFKPVDKDRLLTQAEIGVTYPCSKLSDLYRRSSVRTWGHIKADRGLLIVGVKPRGDSLYKRLTSNSAGITERNLSRIGEATSEIVDRSLHDNSVRMHWLPYPAQGRYRLLLGMRPLCWWPLNPEVVEALLFRRFASMTVYNPAFLIRDLRQGGLEVEARKDGEIKVWKEVGEKRFEIRGIPYFMGLVQEHLFPDSSIALLIQRMVETIDKADFKDSVIVNLDLNFVFQ